MGKHKKIQSLLVSPKRATFSVAPVLWGAAVIHLDLYPAIRTGAYEINRLVLAFR